MKDPKEVAQGKANRKKGAKFELKVRKWFENNDYFIVKNQNNVDLEKGYVVAAKQKFINGRGMGLGSGFPDFIAFQLINRSKQNYFRVIFVECKYNGILSKTEKLKMQFLKDEGYNCWTAYNDKENKIGFRKFVEYKERLKICRKDPKY